MPLDQPITQALSLPVLDEIPRAASADVSADNAVTGE